MLQGSNAKHIAPALTALAAIIAFSGFFGTASRVKATEVRHPTVRHDQGDWLVPTGKGWGRIDRSGHAKGGQGGGHGPGGGGSTNNGIFYHGGPLITGGVHMYYIWYGNWDFSVNNTNAILNDFGNSIGGTNYFGINTTYYDSTPTNVSGMVTLPKTTTDTGSSGSTLSDGDVQNIVANAIASGKLPSDPSGVYFVLASKEVTETSGFCTQYCAWHAHGTIGGQDIKYGFIGDPEQCPSACSVVTSTTAPNQDVAADSMANLIAHELAEATTDPDLNAWYDHRGYENADKCAWKFGSISTSGGTWTNVNFGNRNWLLQQNWINSGGGYCTLTR